MPPKKNAEDIAGEEEANALEDGLVNEEKLQVEINLLGDRYNRCDMRCSELAQTNKKLEFDLLTQKEDQVDIFTYLNTELSKRVEQVARLEAQIQELGAAQEKWERETQEEFAEIKKEQERVVSELTKKISDYKAELDDLQEFTKHKNDLEAKLKSVEEELQQEHDRHLISLTDLERKHAQDREKIKRDYHDRLEADKADLLRNTNNKLEFTTRRTIQENEMMTAELGYQNKQTEKLVKINEQLERENQDMKRDMELCKQAEEDLVKKNYQFQKTIKMMQIKLKAQEIDSQDMKSMEDVNAEKMGGQLQSSEAHKKALEEKLHALRHKYTIAIKEQENLRKQLDEARAETQRMQLLKDEARDFLLACLDDARKQFTVQTGDTKDWTPDHPIPWSLQGLSMAGREALLEYLLARLGGTNFKGSTGRSTRQARGRERGDSPLATSAPGDGPVFPPIGGGRNSPSLEGVPDGVVGASSPFGTWSSKGQLPAERSRAAKVK